MNLIVDNYSGVVINQNQRPAATDDWLSIGDQNWRYQEVFLPSDYTRGDDAGHQITPPLSGWQLFVGITPGTAATASLEWKCEYQIFGIGWVELAHGTQVGIHSEGDQVWMDMPFDEPVDLSAEAAAARLRFGFRVLSGVTKVWYSNPNPLALRGFAKLRAADGVTAIQDAGSDVSVLFRVLGLTVDSGVDFLGNPYRSALRSNVAENTNTVDGSRADAVYMSEPAPSRFAVKSVYYDVRQPSPATYGAYNYIAQPSFEIPSLSAWTANNSTLAQSSVWADKGGYSLLVTGTAQTTGGVTSATFSVVTGRTYTVSATVNPTTLLANGVRVAINWYDLTNTLISTTNGIFQTTIGVGRPSVSGVAPAGAQTARLVVQTTGASGNFSFYVDSAMATQGTSTTYFDGSFPGYRWTRDPHNSVSVEVIEGTIGDDQVVVDNVLVDPVTPGVWFSIYYSSEGDRPTTEEEWEDKLWTRVPGSFQALKRENHKLPSPIMAKFIKIEFSHLQARSYNPGDFAKPVTYKKHPKWVLDYFLARVEAEQSLTDRLTSQRVAVIYDALDLAYNYYLDDLKQEPDKPVEITRAFQSTAQAFLADRSDLSDKVDPEALSRINLAMAPYRDNPAAAWANASMLGQQAQAAATLITGYPAEETRTVPVDVASLRNQAVVMESDYPVMFFFVTCRHKYREVVAPFNYDRAYFVGIREIAFTRERYTTAYDADTYMEPGGDLLNTERNDFVNNEGIMTIGDSPIQPVAVNGVIQ